MIKLGEYRRVMEDVRKAAKLKRTCVEILLWGADMDWFSQYEIGKHLKISDPPIISAMQELLEGNFVKIAREYKAGLSRKYVLTRKGRTLVINFNAMMQNI
jgi:predicted transcriptional regulator